ncbi:MAG TPA: hypothetical protein VGZ47_06665 [Gemmataceae bacterium]|jgi:hypothetical protein|nr:hypothetical protein [Gemmataceae bacterium]
MSSETAEIVLAIVCTIAAIVWLVALWFLVWCYRSAVQPAPIENELGENDPASKDWVRGTVEIEAPMQGLADKAAALFTKISSGSLSITEKTQDRLVFQRVGPAVAGLPERGEIQFSALGGNRTQADYAMQVRGHHGLLVGGVIFQTLGLIALVGGGWAMYEFCVPSPNPDVRGQSFQMIQIIHLLWPPFLFGGLYRARRRMQINQIWFLLRNLPQQA